MAKKLTALAVESAKPVASARVEIPDGGCPGLYLIIQPSGVKSWAVRYRIGGKSRKHTLPQDLTLAGARVAAAQALHQVALGVDPAVEKQAAKAASAEQAALRAADGVAAMVTQFLELHAKRKTRPNSVVQTESVMRRFMLPGWHGRTVHDIRRRDVIALIEPIAVDRPVMANRTLGVLSKFFNWLVARDVIDASPCIGVERPGVEQARDRVLSDVEIAQLWAACGGADPYCAAVRVMTLTGCRRSEVTKMEWTEIAADTGVWTIPSRRSKNRRAHTVPLSPLAWKIISSMPRIAGSSFVFTINGKNPIANISRFRARLDAKLKFEKPFVIHDIRRSVASGLQRLGVRIEVIEAVLGHLSGGLRGIVGVYQRHDFAAEKRQALQLWADHVEYIVSGRSAKVLSLRGRK